MLDPMQSAELFLINVGFDLYLFILMARVILCWVHADYYNPFTSFIVKLTHPVISPFRRVIPTYKNIEFSTLVVIILLEALKFFLLGFIVLGLPTNPAGLFLLAFADTLKLVLNIFFYTILLEAILSWVQQGFSPIGRLLAQFNSPVMNPIRRVMPLVGGMDLSPIPAIIILQLLIILVVTPLLGLGMQVTFG